MPETQWTTTDELLAALLELVDYGNRLYVMTHSKKGTRPPTPIEVRRPYEPAPASAGPRPMATGAELKQFFAAGSS